VYAAASRFELHVPESRSLKQKRAVLRPIVEGIRSRFRVSVAEVGYHDQWQRSAIAVAVVAESAGRLEEVLTSVERFVAFARDIELLEVETTYLDGGGVLAAEDTT